MTTTDQTAAERAAELAEDAMYEAAKTRQAAILARPGVAAIVDQALTLNATQRQALHDAWRAHYRVHRTSQSNLWHRFVHAVGKPHWRDTFAAVEQIARAVRGDRAPYEGTDWGSVSAVEDAAKAVIMGDLLSPSEALVYTGPWLAVLGELPAAAQTGPFVSGWAAVAGASS